VSFLSGVLETKITATSIGCTQYFKVRSGANGRETFIYFPFQLISNWKQLDIAEYYLHVLTFIIYNEVRAVVFSVFTIHAVNNLFDIN